MKLLFFCCLFVFASLSYAQILLEDDFNTSLEAWQNLNARTYSYVVISTYENSVGRTTIRVRNGEVVSRRYVEKSIFYVPGEVLVSWAETTPQTLNTHEGTPAAVTFDELYEDCRENYLTKENPSSTGGEWYARLDVDEKGLISRCGAYPGLGLGSSINVEVVRICY